MVKAATVHRTTPAPAAKAHAAPGPAKREGRYKDRVPTKRRQAIEIERLKAQGVRNRRQAGYRAGQPLKPPRQLVRPTPDSRAQVRGRPGGHGKCRQTAALSPTFLIPKCTLRGPDALPFAKVSVIGDRHDRPVADDGIGRFDEEVWTCSGTCGGFYF